MKMDICVICLRTDRKLKIIDEKLTEFHDELCDFTVTVEMADPRYCSECEYLLRKLYNFREKCVKAIKILKNWKKTKAGDKKPLKLLFTLLPMSMLKVWTPESSKMYWCQHQDPPQSVTDLLTDQSDITVHGNQETKDSLPDEDIKPEIDSETVIKTHLEELLVIKTEDSTIENVMLKSNENTKNDEEFNGADSELDVNIDALSVSSDDSILLSLTKIKIKSKRKHDKFLNCDKPKCATKDTSKRKRSVTKKKIDKDDGKRQRRVTKKKIGDEDSSKRKRFHTNKDIIAELSNINLDVKDGNCEEAISRKKKAVNVERLKSELKKKFASYDEIKTEDGTVIDQEFIINSLEDKVTEYVLKQLWKAVVGKSSIGQRALKLFKSIQNKYKNEYDNCFDIEFLNTKEKMLQEFQRRKTYEAYIEAEYKCEICYQGFKHEKKLEYHKRCHDESAGQFLCWICSVRLKSKKGLIGHFRSHEAVYKCKLCPLVTHYQCSMINHYQLHNGVKFRCEPCDATFRSQSAYRTHVSYRHQRRHVCTACGRAFFTGTGLKWHNTREHQGAPPMVTAGGVACDRCDLSFPTEEVYSRHVRISHEPARKGRKPGTTYDSRLSKPRKKPVLTCRLCNAVGNSVGWLNLHFRMEHPAVEMSTVYADKQAHLCDVCGKGFTTIYTLRAHLSAHTETRAHACACGARFHRALSLRQHARTHAPPARACHHCGKMFRSQSNLANHMRFHVGDRRYKCKICGKGFLHRGTLNEHVRGVHHNVRRVRKRGVVGDTGDTSSTIAESVLT